MTQNVEFFLSNRMNCINIILGFIHLENMIHAIEKLLFLRWVNTSVNNNTLISVLKKRMYIKIICEGMLKSLKRMSYVWTFGQI